MNVIELKSPVFSSNDSKMNDTNGIIAKNTTKIEVRTAIIHLPTLPKLVFVIWPDLPETVVKFLLDLVNQLLTAHISIENIIKITATT